MWSFAVVLQPNSSPNSTLGHPTQLCTCCTLLDAGFSSTGAYDEGQGFPSEHFWGAGSCQQRYSIKKPALSGVAQWITEHQPGNQKVTSSIPAQGTCLSFRRGPQLGACERQPIDVSLTRRRFSPFFSLPSPLSKNKENKILKRNHITKLLQNKTI